MMFCNCLTLIYFMIARSIAKLAKVWTCHTASNLVVILLQMGTTYYHICTLKDYSILRIHSDFIRQDIISFVRVRVKRWRNHCLR